MTPSGHSDTPREPLSGESDAERRQRIAAQLDEPFTDQAGTGARAARLAREAVVEELAKAVLSLADTAGMPDSFWTTDSRVALAREALGVPVDGRYTHAHDWERERV